MERRTSRAGWAAVRWSVALVASVGAATAMVPYPAVMLSPELAWPMGLAIVFGALGTMGLAIGSHWRRPLALAAALVLCALPAMIALGTVGRSAMLAARAIQYGSGIYGGSSLLFLGIAEALHVPTLGFVVSTFLVVMFGLECMMRRPPAWGLWTVSAVAIAALQSVVAVEIVIRLRLLVEVIGSREFELAPALVQAVGRVELVRACYVGLAVLACAALLLGGAVAMARRIPGAVAATLCGVLALAGSIALPGVAWGAVQNLLETSRLLEGPSMAMRSTALAVVPSDAPDVHPGATVWVVDRDRVTPLSRGADGSLGPGPAVSMSDLQATLSVVRSVADHRHAREVVYLAFAQAATVQQLREAVSAASAAGYREVLWLGPSASAPPVRDVINARSLFPLESSLAIPTRGVSFGLVQTLEMDFVAVDSVTWHRAPELGLDAPRREDLRCTDQYPTLPEWNRAPHAIYLPQQVPPVPVHTWLAAVASATASPSPLLLLTDAQVVAASEDCGPQLSEALHQAVFGDRRRR